MQLSDMRAELSERVRAYDESVSADQTVLNRWLNLAQREIMSKWDWTFGKAFYILQTVTDITTGTVSVTLASTAGTYSSAPSVSTTGRYIQTATANNWYAISAHTASETAFTLGQNYLSATNTAVAYTVRQFFYALPSDLDKVISVSQAITPRKMVPLSEGQYDKNFIFSTATGTPEAYYLAHLDSSDNLQIGFYPIPDATVNIYIKYRIRTTDMSATTATGDIPVKNHGVLLDLATAYALNSLKDQRSDFWFTKAYAEIQEMKATDRQDTGHFRVMSAIDERYPKDQIIFRLPPEYGPEGL